MKDELLVVPEKGMWVVKKNKAVHSIHSKKEAAVKVAKILAHNLRTDLYIHRRNGEVLRTRPL
ncbi:MAG: DUF2188 domain-containing protein [Ignavibacteriales bacterium]|nr:MAG: DUF2188 domain-containing protein [Ignavibacteriales bacterium]RPI76379.1 MAG: DUF2188 domain-containing protein [Ignavibacteriales bacterium]